MAVVLTAPLTLLALNLGLHWVIHERPDLRDPIYYGKEDDLADLARIARRSDPDVPVRITIVALGSSRTGNAFHPPTVEDNVTAATGRGCVAYNISLPGGGPVTQLLHLQRLVGKGAERGIKPDLVVVEIIPSMCAEHDGTSPEMVHLRPDRLTREEMEGFEKLGFDSKQYAEYRHDWWETELNPWFGFRFQLLGMLQPKWTPPGVVKAVRHFPDPTGWHPWADPITPESYQRNLKVAYEEHHDNLQKMKLGPIALNAYREIFAICREHGIIAVAVITPEASDFRSWYGPGAQQATATLINEAQHGTGGHVVDAREWLPDTAFADGHHVSRGAALDYSNRLSREVLVPVLRHSPLGPGVRTSPGAH